MNKRRKEKSFVTSSDKWQNDEPAKSLTEYIEWFRDRPLKEEVLVLSPFWAAKLKELVDKPQGDVL